MAKTTRREFIKKSVLITAGTYTGLLTARLGQAAMMGGGSLRQGDAGGWATQMTNKVVALTRAGAIVWTADLSQPMGMMP